MVFHSPVLLVVALAVAVAACKKSDPLAELPAPAMKVAKSMDDEPPVKLSPPANDTVPGGSDDDEINQHSPDRVAKQWLRAARSDDILKLARLSPALAEPHTGATLDDDGLRAYYSKLLTDSQDWTSQKPAPVSRDRVKSFLSRNRVDGDLKKAAAGANYVIAADGGDEKTAILLTVRGEYVTSAIEIPYKGELP